MGTCRVMRFCGLGGSEAGITASRQRIADRGSGFQAQRLKIGLQLRRGHKALNERSDAPRPNHS
jgi:hypothetical protein